MKARLDPSPTRPHSHGSACSRSAPQRRRLPSCCCVLLWRRSFVSRIFGSSSHRTTPQKLLRQSRHWFEWMECKFHTGEVAEEQLRCQAHIISLTHKNCFYCLMFQQHTITHQHYILKIRGTRTLFDWSPFFDYWHRSVSLNASKPHLNTHGIIFEMQRIT